MKKSIIALAALAFMAWGCNSSDDDDQMPIPAESVTAASADNRPTWDAPNYDLYEQTMVVEVLLQEKLKTYASAQDMLCATINNEVRGVATPVQLDSTWMFPLTIASNNVAEDISLSYYCEKLHRIYTIEWTTFDATVAPTGKDGIYLPVFVK